jgi:acetyl-CoA synthetase
LTHPENIARLLQPKSIAVIGGSLAETVIRQCDQIGFNGEIWPVTPFAEQLGGRKTFSSIEQLPGSPDASFIAVNKHGTIETAAALNLRGAGGAVCYASGFSEAGSAGEALQIKLDRAMGEMAYVGPNCYGLLNYLDGVALWPDEQGGGPIDRGVAVVMQSGNIGISVTMQQRALPLAYMISVGNQAGIQMHEYVTALIQDERVSAVGLHIEGLADVAAFSEAAIQALEARVPIVVLKTGISERGRELTMSHTSSLSGADELYDGLFDRLGIIRVRSLPEFLETLKFLSIVGPLAGPTFASISCSGGEAAIMADTAHRLGVPAAEMIEPQRSELARVLGDNVAINNPLDYHTYIWDNEEAQFDCFASMMLGPQHVTLKILDYPRPDVCSDAEWVKTARAFVRAVDHRGTPAALVSTLHENLPIHAQDMLVSHGIAPMLGLEECLVAVRGAALVARRQSEAVKPLDPSIKPIGPAQSMNEAESKSLLARFQVPVPNFQTFTIKSMSQTANTLTYPVVLKILSDSIIHKTDAGGVALNLPDAVALLEAAADMRQLGDDFLVEPMAPAPVAELILGVGRDPQFGLYLMIGAGGILVELLRDSAVLLLPTSRGAISAALEGLQSYPLLTGFRGASPADIDAIIDTVLDLAAFAAAHPDRLYSVDLNPVFVYSDGQGLIAVDAVVQMVRQ